MAQIKDAVESQPTSSKSIDLSPAGDLSDTGPPNQTSTVSPAIDDGEPVQATQVEGEPHRDSKLYRSLIDQLNLIRSEKTALEQELGALRAKLESTSNELEREVQRRCDLEQRFSEEARKSANVVSLPTTGGQSVTSVPVPTSPTVQTTALIATNTIAAPVSTASSSKHYGQHAISQLPMTTRKKLSHLRAQIKRQASKAARSRLEKRSSVAGVGTSSSEVGASHHSTSDHKGPFGTSLDATLSSSNRHATGDLFPTNSTSLDSPSVYLSSGSTMSPSGAGGNNSGSSGQATNANSTTDATINLSSSHGQQSVENNVAIAAATSGLKHTSIGQHHLNSSHNNSSIGVSVHQKNFKQKLIALIKKFRTDGSDFDSEEQYREALERELMKAAAGRGSKAIEELLEEEIDDDAASGSELEDWDNISETSTPKPSLRPFFSSTTLDKI